MESLDVSRFFLSLAFVIFLIWLCAFMLKRFGLDKRLRGVTGATVRLAITEVLYLDQKRKLMMVRADKKEYLLLLAGDSATVLDTATAKKEKA